MAVLKVFSLNVYGLRDVRKRRQVFQIASKSGHDISFFQETFSLPEDSWAKEWKGKSLFSSLKSNQGGCAILFKPHLKVLSSQVDPLGRYIIAKVQRFSQILRCATSMLLLCQEIDLYSSLISYSNF